MNNNHKNTNIKQTTKNAKQGNHNKSNKIPITTNTIKKHAQNVQTRTHEPTIQKNTQDTHKTRRPNQHIKEHKEKPNIEQAHNKNKRQLKQKNTHNNTSKTKNTHTNKTHAQTTIKPNNQHKTRITKQNNDKTTTTTYNINKKQEHLEK